MAPSDAFKLDLGEGIVLYRLAPSTEIFGQAIVCFRLLAVHSRGHQLHGRKGYTCGYAPLAPRCRERAALCARHQLSEVRKPSMTIARCTGFARPDIASRGRAATSSSTSAEVV